jgi:hypothetical protein
MCFEATLWSEKTTLSKAAVYRVQKNTRQTNSGCKKTLGKQALYRVKKKHSTNKQVCQVQKINTQQLDK